MALLKYCNLLNVPTKIWKKFWGIGCWTTKVHIGWWVSILSNGKKIRIIGRSPDKTVFGELPVIGLESNVLPNQINTHITTEEELEDALSKNHEYRHPREFKCCRRQFKGINRNQCRSRSSQMKIPTKTPLKMVLVMSHVQMIRVEYFQESLEGGEYVQCKMTANVSCGKLIVGNKLPRHSSAI